MKVFKICVAAILIFQLNGTFAQTFVSLPEQLSKPRYAEWITMPDIQGNEYGVYYFRKTIRLEQPPERFTVHVSADNRYRLFVNGKQLCWGPAVGDLNNWNYETIDLAQALKKGKNTIAAQVWNMGKFRGARQISSRTAFILQGDSETEEIVNTNSSWKVTRDPGYYPISHSTKQVGGGYIAGATDSLHSTKHPWGWESISFDDTNWQKPLELGKGNHAGLNTWHGTPWLLKPRTIPFMEQYIEKTPRILNIEGRIIKPENPTDKMQLRIPANSKAEILLDNEKLTMGFPKLIVSKGKNAIIKIQYQEALFDDDNHKANRNEWKNKQMKGYYDIFIPDGGLNREFEPLWIRVFRYVKITIETKSEELAVNGFNNLFTAYPFEQKGSFTSDSKMADNIWDVSWHTARLCALENYMDCPYYEQLQYIGDTRIQALISLYIAGDDRLVKNAISQFYNSMQPMGLTKSSHPQHGIQIIPPFSLLFICMIHDYFMLRDDDAFLKPYMPGLRFILDWFVLKTDSTGMLGPLPFWNHIDGGTPEFKAGSPPGITEGHSAHMSILLANTIKKAVEMFEHFEYTCDAKSYEEKAIKLTEATLLHCYDEEKGLLAETPKKELFTQHTNSMAILADAFSEGNSKIVAQKLIEDKTLAQATLYFNFYVFQALKKTGRGGEILNQLDKWKTFIDYGFTTFPEHGINSRSDCHAWSSHPMYNFLNITCGIEPSSPGFKTVHIQPQPGKLRTLSGSIAHPLGEITTSYKITENEKIHCSLILPDKLTGTFFWNGTTYRLESGENHYILDIN